MDGGPGETLPGIQGPRNRPGQAQSTGSVQSIPAHCRACGTAGQEDTPGTHAASAPARPLTVPAYHEAHSATHWAAGRWESPGHSSCPGTGPAMPGPCTTPMGRRAGEIRQDRPGHGTSQWHTRTHTDLTLMVSHQRQVNCFGDEVQNPLDSHLGCTQTHTPTPTHSDCLSTSSSMLGK